MSSPTRPKHAGLGKQRFAAAASENSALDNDESPPGNASNHDEDILSRCFHDNTALRLIRFR